MAGDGGFGLLRAVRVSAGENLFGRHVRLPRSGPQRARARCPSLGACQTRSSWNRALRDPARPLSRRAGPVVSIAVDRKRREGRASRRRRQRNTVHLRVQSAAPAAGRARWKPLLRTTWQAISGNTRICCGSTMICRRICGHRSRRKRPSFARPNGESEGRVSGCMMARSGRAATGSPIHGRPSESMPNAGCCFWLWRSGPPPILCSNGWPNWERAMPCCWTAGVRPPWPSAKVPGASRGERCSEARVRLRLFSE